MKSGAPPRRAGCGAQPQRARLTSPHGSPGTLAGQAAATRLQPAAKAFQRTEIPVASSSRLSSLAICPWLSLTWMRWPMNRPSAMKRQQIERREPDLFLQQQAGEQEQTEPCRRVDGEQRRQACAQAGRVDHAPGQIHHVHRAAHAEQSAYHPAREAGRDGPPPGMAGGLVRDTPGCIRRIPE